MGYVNVTDISVFVPPSMIGKTAGTWTSTLSSNKVYDVRTAADAAFSLIVPLVLPGSQVGLQGAKIKSVDFWYRIGTVDADDFATVEVSKMALTASGVAPTGAAVTVSIDAAHDAAAERKAVDYHKMTVTLDTAEFVKTDTNYYLTMTIDAAAGSVVWVYGAQIHYTLRL